MFKSIKLQMIGYESWVEFAVINGQPGTYYMVKSESTPAQGQLIEYSMKDYKTGDYFEEFIRKYGSGESPVNTPA